MYLFLLAFNYILDKIEAATSRGSIARRKNYLGYVYEPCNEVSYAMRELSRKLEVWPQTLIDKFERTKKKRKLVFEPKGFAEPTIGPFIVP